MRRAAAGTRRLTTPIRPGVQAGRTAQIVASSGILPQKRVVLRRFSADLHHAENHPAGRCNGLPPATPKRRRARSLGRHDARARPAGGRGGKGSAQRRAIWKSPESQGGKARGGRHGPPEWGRITRLLASRKGSGRFWRHPSAGSGCAPGRPAHRRDRPGGLGTRRDHPRGGPQRASAPVLKEICPLPAHGRATSRMKKIKQRQYQRTKSRERAASRSTSGHSGGRVAPHASARLRGGAGRDSLSFRS